MSTTAEKAVDIATGMPEPWPRVRLGDICEIVRGVSYKKEQASEQPAKGKVPILRATNIQNSVLILDSDLIYVPVSVVSEEQMLRAGDIVVATSSGSKHLVGKTAQVKESWAGSFGAFCAALRPIVQIDHRYLGYFFASKEYKDYITKRALGVNINNLRRGDLEEILVPVAPLDQQKRIVAEIEKQFSRLDEAVANLKRVKANLKRYKAAVLKAAIEGRLVETEAELARREGRGYETGAQLLQRTLETRRSQWKGKGKYKEPAAPDTTDLPELPEGWVWASAVQACDPVVDCHNKTAPYTDSGIPLVRTTNIRDGRLFLEEVRYVDQPTYDFWSRRCPPEPGDVLFTREAPMGEAAIIPPETKLCMGQRMMLMRPSSVVSAAFLLYSLLSPVIRRLIERASVGTGVKHLRVGDVELLPVPIPPIAEQYRIVPEMDRRLTLVREVEAQVDVNLKRTERLRQTVLTAAFSGAFNGDVSKHIRDTADGVTSRGSATVKI
ncbi:MAG: restriction endonuclease subunit S [Bradyrhizobium sp.]|uniref:restriction endonuclease subunit S n=1 Tax=Bradyrhizobium sp. TaxID=376 RepID=UPI003D0C4B4C